jgi:hypothetical protein
VAQQTQVGCESKRDPKKEAVSRIAEGFWGCEPEGREAEGKNARVGWSMAIYLEVCSRYGGFKYTTALE